MTNKADAQQAAPSSDEPRVHNRYHNTAPKDAVYIGRGTIWGNPSRMSDEVTRDQACDRFEAYAQATPGFRALTRNLLKGRHLVCSCAPKRCHGNWLLMTANSEETPEELEEELAALKRIKGDIERLLNLELDSHNDLDDRPSTGLNADRFVSNLHANVALLTDGLPLSAADEEDLIDILERVVESALGVIRLLIPSMTTVTQSSLPIDASHTSSLGMMVAASAAICEGSLELLVRERIIISEELEETWIQDLINGMKHDLLSILQKLLFGAEGSHLFFSSTGLLNNDGFLEHEVFRTQVRISRRPHPLPTPDNRGTLFRAVSLTVQALPNLSYRGKSLSKSMVRYAIRDLQIETLEMCRKGVTSRQALLEMKLAGDPPF